MRPYWKAFSQLVINGGGTSPLWVMPLLVGDSGFNKKAAGKAMGSKPVSNTLSWSLHQPVPAGSCSV